MSATDEQVPTNDMASPNEVKNYLAHWFQLGKHVVLGQNKIKLLPEQIFAGSTYSQEFEDCWQNITTSNHKDAYLEGTEQTIANLLSSEWEIVACARCRMPVPIRYVGLPAAICPCHDLDNWPNDQLPHPNCPVDNQVYLARIRYRLMNRPNDNQQSNLAEFRFSN